jgi:uncharacterized protein (DUF1810 family)
MVNSSETDYSVDLFNLNRFLSAQEKIYETVLAELASGQKRTCWMWYIFPQLAGLGNSIISEFYSIKSIGEAQAYFNHPIFGARLLQSVETTLAIKERLALKIFGFPDYLKPKSCMTLFECVDNSHPIFSSILNKYYNDKRDLMTIQLLENLIYKKVF